MMLEYITVFDLIKEAYNALKDCQENDCGYYLAKAVEALADEPNIYKMVKI